MARHLFIAGIDRNTDYIKDSLTIEQVLTQAVDTCSFSIRGEKPEEGQEVIIEDDTLGRLFGGIIDRVQLTDYSRDAFRVWQVDAQDYTYQLDRKLVVETYQNMAADEIARDIITKYGGRIFTTNHIQTGAPVVEEIVFDYVAPSAALKDLADYVGWDWYVDYDRNIWFFDPASLGQPAPLSLEPGGYFRNLKHTIDQQGLRNRVYVRGGTMLSDPWTYEIKADGSARAWVLPHKPHDVTVMVAGVAKTCGIENVHEESEYDFLMNYEEKYVRCSVQTPTPAQGVTLSFTYRYDIDVITMVEDVASQQAIAAVQGGDGVYEHVIVDDSLTTIDAAEAAGNADLREHANPQVKGSFETEVPGWTPGQLVTINLPDRGITGTFLVQKVTITPCTLEKWTYRVEYGGRLLGIADWLQALWKAQQKKKLNETALLHKFHYGAEMAKVTDEVQGTLRTPSWKVEQGLESLLDITMPGGPTFTRSSNAYKSDGTQVAANTPRFEQGKFGQAIMVEEGTTNLVTNPSFENGTTGWSIYNYGTFAQDATQKLFGSYSCKFVASTNQPWCGIKQTVTVTAGVTYTLSAYFKAESGGKFAVEVAAGQGFTSQLVTPIPGSWQRVSLTFTVPSGVTSAELRILPNYGLNTSCIVYIDGVQFEQKPYATSFIDDIRADEKLTIPIEVLNHNAFTFEMWIKQSIITTSAFQHGKRLLDLGQGLWLWNFSPAWPDPQGANRRIIADFGQDASGTRQYLDLISQTLFSTVNFEYFAITFDGATFRFYRNGTLWASYTPNKINPFTQIVLGDAGWIIDDLRISNRARTDEEIAQAYASGQPLPVDEWTTYKLNFDGDLSRYVGFGQQYATAGGLARVQQLDSNPWSQLQYATSTDGSTWSAWSGIDNKVIDVPYPGYLKVRGATRLPVKVGVCNWKKPFDQTDVVCGFVMTAS